MPLVLKAAGGMMLNASPGACTYWGAMEGDEAASGITRKSLCALVFQ